MHWNYNGDKFVTSSRDGIARVWDHFGNLESVKNFNMMLMVSKFNGNDSYGSNLVATGGHSNQVMVWDIEGK